MKATTLSALALLVLAGALRADPPGVVERIERGGGYVRRDGVGGPVNEVVLRPGSTDADLAGLCELRGLAKLALIDTRLTDDGLRTVAGLTHLRRLDLDLDGAGVTDAGLRHLGEVGGMKELRLV